MRKDLNLMLIISSTEIKHLEHRVTKKIRQVQRKSFKNSFHKFKVIRHHAGSKNLITDQEIIWF